MYQWQPRWSPLAPGSFKCNIDVAFIAYQHTCTPGLGLCLCDAEGKLPSPVAEGEAITVKETIKWILSSDLVNQVANSINKGSKDVFEFGSITRICRSLLLDCPILKVLFARRHANSVAYGLARSSINFANPHVFHPVPNCIDE
ncbi:hypothetical protein HKD37_15G043316 [Glycine soja]